MTRTWLDELRPLGTLPAEAAGELRAIGEDEIADELDEAAHADVPPAYGTSRLRLRRDPVWRHTSYVIGTSPARWQNLRHPARWPDRGRRAAAWPPAEITLYRLRVADYPGRGMHHILFDFAVENQTEQGRSRSASTSAAGTRKSAVGIANRSRGDRQRQARRQRGPRLLWGGSMPRPMGGTPPGAALPPGGCPPSPQAAGTGSNAPTVSAPPELAGPSS